MRHWIVHTILGFVSGITHAADTSSKRPTLTFEVAVPADFELHKGLSAAFKEILDRQGYDFRSMSLPSKRGLQDLKAGRVDGSLARMKNLSQILEAKDVIRVDVPIAIIQITRWCRKDLERSKRPFRVGTRLGNLVLLVLKQQMDPSNVMIDEIANQKGVAQMIKSGRLDCLLSSDPLLQADGVVLKQLDGLDRFDLISIELYPWIAKRHLALKEHLESGLKAYQFSATFRKAFLDQRPACEGKLNVLCPDGVLFLKKVELDLLPGGSADSL